MRDLPGMKLFHTPAVSALAARILVAESGLPVRPVRVRASVGLDEDGADFRALSPGGKLPALYLDDETLLDTEMDMALALLARMPPHPVTAPLPDMPAFQQIRMCLTFLAQAVHVHFPPLLRLDTAPSAQSAARTALTRAYAQLDAMLARQAFLLGDTFTLPDGYAFTLLTWNPLISLDTAAWPALEAYTQRVRQRPSVTAALAAEGLLEGWRDDLQPWAGCDPSRRA